MKKIILILLLLQNILFSQEVLMGIVKPIYDAKIGVAVDGIVSNIYYEEGQRVKNGDVIIQLDDKLQTLETKRRKIVYDDKIQVKSLGKNVDLFEKILESKEKLYNSTKSISLNELNNITMQYISSKAEYETLLINEEKEKIEYEISVALLDSYKIKSPVDGIITKIEPKLGEWVQVGDKAVHIVNDDVCFVEVDIDVISLQHLKVGSKVEIEVDINQQIIKKSGKVSFISAIADSSSSLIRAKINFENKKDKVIPGLQARIIF